MMSVFLFYIYRKHIQILSCKKERKINVGSCAVQFKFEARKDLTVILTVLLHCDSRSFLAFVIY